ncbi:MAG TPA: MBL fold metallo-hydrolase [Thermoanaerobaculia bacterium]|nr:MBL fold metallo-hydrolase [Thermoanaerobaculia bacterium]
MSATEGESLYEKVLRQLAAAGKGGPVAELPAPRASAAVVPWRQSRRSRRTDSEVEVYWVRRSAELPFMGGWHAFPGGGLARTDAGLPVAGTPRGLAGAADVADAVGLPDTLRDTVETVGPDLVPGIVACALRELFEETGLLLASPSPPVSSADLDRERRALLEREKGFGEVLAALGATLDATALIYAGRWLTPPFAPLRFDNRFFLLEWPEEAPVQPTVWPGELAEGEWIDPEEAWKRWHAGDVLAAPPILHILRVLAEDGPEGGLPRLVDPSETNLGPFRRIELRPGVLVFPLAVQTLPPAATVNCYLLGHGEAVLVDPGSPGTAESERLLCALAAARERYGLAVTAIWLTHHHPDHVGGVAQVAAHLGVPVCAHERTADRLAGRGIAVDRLLQDGERIVLAGHPPNPPMTVRVVHTPGHARGHLCFFDEAGGSLLAGDMVAGLGMIVVDPPEGDMDDYLASLEKMIALAPQTLFPGHGPAVKDAQAKLREYIAHRLWREERVLAAAEAGQTPAEMLPTVYDDVPTQAYPLAERQILAHLERLRRAGRLPG